MQTIERTVPLVQNESGETLKKHHILLVNLLGFTRLSPKKDPQELEEIQQTFNTIVNSSVALFKGNIVKNAGYAYLATFETAADVLRAGLKIESGIYRHNLKEGKPGLEVKLAINTDEPVVSERWDEVFAAAPAVKPAAVRANGNGNGNGNGKTHASAAAPPVTAAPVKKEPAHEPKPAVRTHAKPSPRREIRIPIPGFVVDSCAMCLAAARYDVFKDRDRSLRTILLLAGLMAAGARTAGVRYPILPAYLRDQTARPAGDIADLVESEVSRNRLASVLKKPVASLVRTSGGAKARPGTQVTTLAVPESEAPAIIKTPPAQAMSAVPLTQTESPRYASENFKEGLEIEQWTPSQSDGASLAAEFTPQAQGRAILMKYDLGAAGWAQIARTLWIENLEKEAIVFYYRAQGNANDLEIKLGDDDGTVYGTRLTFNPDGGWHKVKIPFKDFTYREGGNSILEYASRLNFAVRAGQGGAGEIVIDQVRVAWAD